MNTNREADDSCDIRAVCGNFKKEKVARRYIGTYIRAKIGTIIPVYIYKIGTIIPVYIKSVRLSQYRWNDVPRENDGIKRLKLDIS